MSDVFGAIDIGTGSVLCLAVEMSVDGLGREIVNESVITALGAGTASAASHDFDPDKVGFVNLSVLLNTVEDAWTIEWLVDDATIRGPIAFGDNPTINYAGMAAWNTATGAVDNFSLRVVPEPASWLLLALGSLWLMLPRRRAR